VTAGQPPALDEQLSTVRKQEAQEAVGVAEDHLAVGRGIGSPAFSQWSSLIRL